MVMSGRAKFSISIRSELISFAGNRHLMAGSQPIIIEILAVEIDFRDEESSAAERKERETR
jgi:hypothetical protein